MRFAAEFIISIWFLTRLMGVRGKVGFSSSFRIKRQEEILSGKNLDLNSLGLLLSEKENQSTRVDLVFNLIACPDSIYEWLWGWIQSQLWDAFPFNVEGLKKNNTRDAENNQNKKVWMIESNHSITGVWTFDLSAHHKPCQYSVHYDDFGLINFITSYN